MRGKTFHAVVRELGNPRGWLSSKSSCKKNRGISDDSWDRTRSLTPFFPPLPGTSYLQLRRCKKTQGDALGSTNHDSDLSRLITSSAIMGKTIITVIWGRQTVFDLHIYISALRRKHSTRQFWGTMQDPSLQAHYSVGIYAYWVLPPAELLWSPCRYEMQARKRVFWEPIKSDLEWQIQVFYKLN